MFLCRDKVGNGGGALCHDIIFYVATECGKLERFCVATKNFMLRHSWLGWEEIMLRLSIFMPRQLAKARRNYVATEHFMSR